MKISLLINVKMPTIVGIFIFISRENFVLSRVEHGKSFNYWFNYWFSFTLVYSRISHEYSSLFIIVINLIFMFSL